MSKLIILNGHTQAVMTFDEIYHKYQGLLKNRASRWMRTYEYDEVFQTAAIGLWQAYQKYDAAHGFSFMALACKVIDTQLLQYHQKHAPRFNNKTSKIKSMTSLNKTMPDNEDTELQDLIGEAETFSQEIVDNLFFEKIIRKLPKVLWQYVSYYLDGYKKAEIAEFNGISQAEVSIKIQAALKRLQGLYVKEMAL